MISKLKLIGAIAIYMIAEVAFITLKLLGITCADWAWVLFPWYIWPGMVLCQWFLMTSIVWWKMFSTKIKNRYGH